MGPRGRSREVPRLRRRRAHRMSEAGSLDKGFASTKAAFAMTADFEAHCCVPNSKSMSAPTLRIVRLAAYACIVTCCAVVLPSAAACIARAQSPDAKVEAREGRRALYDAHVASMTTPSLATDLPAANKLETPCNADEVLWE